MMTVKKFLTIGVYNGENKLVGLGIRDDKTGKTILYNTEEMGFDEVAEFLERVAKNGEPKVATKT